MVNKLFQQIEPSSKQQGIIFTEKSLILIFHTFDGFVTDQKVNVLYKYTINNGRIKIMKVYFI